MTAGKTKKLGGLWYKSVPMLEAERLLKTELATFRHPTAVIWSRPGRMYLTDSRIVWSPWRIYSWLLTLNFMKPVVISLADVEECAIARADFVLRAMELRTSGETYQFLMDRIFGKRKALEWKDTIDNAVRTAKQPAEGRR